MKKYSDMLCGLFGMALAAAIFILSIGIRLKEGDAIGAAFMPQITAMIVFALSAVLTGRGWQSSKVYIEKQESERTNGTGVLLMAAACLGYGIILKPAGFIISSAGFLYLSLCLMTKKEERSYIRFAVVTVLGVLAIYLVFTEFFGIRLPHGIL